jgi:aldose 1-epimerase
MANHGSREEAEIIAGRGAVLSRLLLSRGGELLSIIDGFSAPAMVRTDRAFRGAWLLPFPNRVGGGRFHFGGREYALPLNYAHEGHAIHGFLYDQPFRTTGTTIARDSAAVVLTHSYGGQLQGFPFEFDARICYKLNNGSGLTCTAEVTNTGATAMPLGIGWHPYVTLGKPIERLLLRVPGTHRVVLGADMIPTGELAPVAESGEPVVLGQDMLDSTFEVDHSGGTVGTDLSDPESGVTIRVWQECHRGQFRYVHVYTPPDRRSVAIEPMTCWADALNNQRGLLVLRPGDSTKVRCGVRLI